MTTVGAKYQVVIERDARQALGVQPGWKAVQTVVGDHLEVRFVPPEHNRSLAGKLHRYARAPRIEPSGQEQRAWETHVEDRWGRA